MKKFLAFLVLTLTLALSATFAGCSLKTEITDLKNNEHNEKLRFVLSVDKEYYSVKAKETTSSIKIPDTYNGKPVKEILPAGFANLNLTTVTLGANIEKIGDYAFTGNNLTTVTLPDSVEYIGKSAFSRNSSLATIYFNDGVDMIAEDAFVACANLTNIVVDDVNAWIRCSFSGANSNPIALNSDAMFLFNGSIQSVYPSSITTLNLDGVTKIGYNSTYGLNISSVNAPSVVDFAKIDFDWHECNPISNGASLYVNNEKVTELTAENLDGATKIGAFAFANYALTSITLPQTLTEIGLGAFYKVECDISIPASVKSIGAMAFAKDDYDLVKYTVTFDSQGGSSVQAQIFDDKNDALSRPTNPTRSGYLFAGWYDNEQCEGAPYDFAQDITGDITLYAKWVATTAGLMHLGTNSITASNFLSDFSEHNSFMFAPLKTGTYIIESTTSKTVDCKCVLYDEEQNEITTAEGVGDSNLFKIEQVLEAGKVYYLQPMVNTTWGSNKYLSIEITGPANPAGGKMSNTMVDISSTSSITFEGEGSWTLTPILETEGENIVVDITSSTTVQDIVTYFIHTNTYYTWSKN